MEDKDRKRFSQIMTGLAEDCSAIMTAAGLSMRFEALKTFTIGQVESAVLSVMRENVYTKMPTTGTIINAIEGTKDDKAEYQFGLVLKAIRITGSYGSPTFGDPVTHNIVHDRFGWGKICAIPQNEMSFFEKEFKAAYSIRSQENFEQKAIGFGQSESLAFVKNICHGVNSNTGKIRQ